MLLPRSVSYRRFAVSGRRPDALSAEFAESLQRRQFTSLAEDGAEQESIGWTSFDNFLDTELLPGSYFDQGYVRLGLRMDKRVVSAGLVKAHVALEMRALRASGEGKPSKREIDAIREGVVEMLRPQTPPKTQFIRAVWNVKTKMLYLVGLADAGAERFNLVFSETFEGRKLVSLEPLSLVRHLDVSRDLMSQLELLEPADFRPADGVSRRQSPQGLDE